MHSRSAPNPNYPGQILKRACATDDISSRFYKYPQTISSLKVEPHTACYASWQEVIYPSSFTSGSSLNNQDNFDEKTILVTQTSNHPIPAEAKDTQQNGHTKWETDRDTPVITSLKKEAFRVLPEWLDDME